MVQIASISSLVFVLYVKTHLFTSSLYTHQYSKYFWMETVYSLAQRFCILMDKVGKGKKDWEW